MKRVITLLKTDMLLQQRYKFLYAAAFITVVWAALLLPLNDKILEIGIPLIIFTDLGIVGFYLLAGMILYEKAESTLRAIIVSPVRFHEYLFSKVAAFTVLSVIMSLFLTAAVYHRPVNWPLLLLGTVLTSVFALLIAFTAVAKYNSISTFLLPSQLYMAVINLPLLNYFHITDWKLLYLIPTQGMLWLLKGAFVPVESWKLAAGTLYSILWIAAMVYAAKISYKRWILGWGG